MSEYISTITSSYLITKEFLKLKSDPYYPFEEFETRIADIEEKYGTTNK